MNQPHHLSDVAVQVDQTHLAPFSVRDLEYLDQRREAGGVDPGHIRKVDVEVVPQQLRQQMTPRTGDRAMVDTAGEMDNRHDRLSSTAILLEMTDGAQ
jgi:hypothetical protein